MGGESLSHPSPPRVGGQAIRPGTSGVILIGDANISPGQQTTLDGKYISVGSVNIVLGTETYLLPTAARTKVESAPSVVAAWPNDASFSIARYGALVVHHETLSDGQITTISGHAISVGSSIVMVDGTSYPLPTMTGSSRSERATEEPLGAVIASMFGCAPASTSGDPLSSTSGAYANAKSKMVDFTTSEVTPSLISFTSSQSRVSRGGGFVIIMVVGCIYFNLAGVS